MYLREKKDIFLLQPASNGNPKKGRRGSMCLSQEQVGPCSPREHDGVQEGLRETMWGPCSSCSPM